MDQAGPPWTVLPCATPKAIELKRGSRYTTFSQHPTQPSLLKAEYKTNSPDAERIPPWKEIITNRRSKQIIKTNSNIRVVQSESCHFDTAPHKHNDANNSRSTQARARDCHNNSQSQQININKKKNNNRFVSHRFPFSLICHVQRKNNNFNEKALERK